MYNYKSQETDEKVRKSIERLKAFEPPEGYYLAFSGGKDSVVCKALCDLAGVKYDAHYTVTSVDPPELVQYIRDKHPDVSREIPRDTEGKPITMWTLIPRHLMPPTRVFRYCCSHLKEPGGNGRMVVTGVRWSESSKRASSHGIVTMSARYSPKKVLRQVVSENGTNFKQIKGGGVIMVNDNTESRRVVERCYARAATNLNPIVDWDDHDVWNFIRGGGYSYCDLYDCGFHRLGCILCPLSSRKNRLREAARWPKYKEQYLRSFAKMLEARKAQGRAGDAKEWTSPEAVYAWWLEDPNPEGQMSLFGEADGG